MNIIELSPGRPVSMHDDWYDTATTSNHFWMKWRLRAFRPLLEFLPADRPLLEIGCGNAVLRDQVETLGFTVDGCDLNRNALNAARQGKGRLFQYDIFDRHPEMTGAYSGILLMDVLEHVDDDHAFLKTAADHAKTDGLIFINVPALPSLFSAYDHAVGHVRRYTKSSLEALMRDCGIETLTIRYWGLTLLPIALARKLLLRKATDDIVKKGFRPPNKMINDILNRIGSVESVLPAPPVGTSLIAAGYVRR